jgi:glycosyltransferase involved in cell wall biosynthesis
MVENKQPILSIVVPTKNRNIYAMSSIKSLLRIEDNSIEIVIHDNSDDNSLGIQFKKEIKDHRLKYFYCQDRITPIENFDLAVSQAIGEYVICIGDDDTDTREKVNATRWTKANDIDAILPTRSQ